MTDGTHMIAAAIHSASTSIALATGALRQPEEIVEQRALDSAAPFPMGRWANPWPIALANLTAVLS